jgi:hypothetical protein
VKPSEPRRRSAEGIAASNHAEMGEGYTQLKRALDLMRTSIAPPARLT